MTVENDLGGVLQTQSNRFFGLRELGIQIVSRADGTETIPDSLAAG